MKKMRLFIDTHNRDNDTFPKKISKADFAEFYEKYISICEEEGVVNLRAHIGLEHGRGFCFNMVPDIESIRIAHERAGLPYDSIVEVETITPGDMFLALR